MTSTHFNVGLRDGQRLSSRVLRPPGGGHTNIFGETEELQNPNQEKSIPESTIDIEQPKEHPTGEINGASQPDIKEAEMKQGASSVETVKEDQVKLELKPAPAATAAAPLQELPRRVRVPPGGFSSGLW